MSESNHRPVIEISGLTKRYRSVLAVTDLSLQIPKGGVFGLLGPNGSGKSTTIGVILGLVRPTSGAVRLFGERIQKALPGALRRIGASIEAPTFYPFLSGRANLRYFQGLGHPEHRRQVDHLLEVVGLVDAADRPYETYSMGMRQRLAIARALLGDPELVILDEPTNGLDPGGVTEVRDMIRRLGDGRRTVLLSSHQLSEVEQVCDRVAILFRGQLRAQGPVSTLLDLHGTTFRVRTTNDELARRILTDLEWASMLESDGSSLIVQVPHERAGQFTRILAEASVFVTEFTPLHRSLEDFFLEVTRDRSPGRGESLQ